MNFRLSVQVEGEGTVSAMVVEKRKLDIKVKELKDRVQVRGETLVLASGLEKMLRDGRKKKKKIINGPGSRLNLFHIRWRIKASRTWKTSRMSTTSRSTRWKTEVREVNPGSERIGFEKNKQSMEHSWVGLLDKKLNTFSVENEMNSMTQKDLEREKLTVERMCLELKAKRQVSRQIVAPLTKMSTAMRSFLISSTNKLCWISYFKYA